MRGPILLMAAVALMVIAQETEAPDGELKERLGLLGSLLGLNPLGSNRSSSEETESQEVEEEEREGEEEEVEKKGEEEEVEQKGDKGAKEVDEEESPLASLAYPDYQYDDTTEDAVDLAVGNFYEDDEDLMTGKFTITEVLEEEAEEEVKEEAGVSSLQCCCIPATSFCPTDREPREQKLVPAGDTDSVVFQAGFGELWGLGCGEGKRECCFPSTTEGACMEKGEKEGGEIPSAPFSSVEWEAGCSEQEASSCGMKGQGEAERAPWACVLLTRDNGFVGTCAILGPRAVITAAHKLNKIIRDSQLKVRVGDYDLRDFKEPETRNFKEMGIVKIIRHPDYNPKRLSNDVAILLLETKLDVVEPHVAPVCLPACADYFPSSSAVKCEVMGWGTDPATGALLPRQSQRSVSLVSSSNCTASLQQGLNSRVSGSGDRFSLSSSEVCAEGVQGEEGQCGGDGGSPLVCQAESGRWSLVGLVTWAVGCQGPVVHARVGQFLNWIANVTVVDG